MNNKCGFTVIEIIITIIVIGIIFASSVSSIFAVKNSYTALTYYAHNHVLNMVRIIKGNNSINFSTATAENFCNAFAGIANTLGSKSCGTTYAINTAGTEPAFNAITFTTPSFTLMNGMRFYFSPRHTPASGDLVSETQGYRLIGVDVNGKSKPNILTTTNTNRPTDFVTFLVLDNGEVYPLGVAADNLSAGTRKLIYLNSVAKGYYFSNNSNRSSKSKDCLKSDGNYRCNFGVENIIGNTSYRDAYCCARAGDDSYPKYCTNYSYSKNSKCVSGTDKYDLCKPETIKPMFRYGI